MPNSADSSRSGGGVRRRPADVVAGRGRRRDQAGDQRDAVAEARDREAELSETLLPAGHDPAHSLALLARRAAASDRLEAQHDRHSSAMDRQQCAMDRASASLDSLTQAYLRGPGLAEVERDIARAKRTAQPLTLAFIDVDHLKAINDAFGHAAGDRLLRKVVVRLRQAVRSYDR